MKTEYVLGPRVFSICEIVFTDKDDKTLVYAPKEDITTFELAIIIKMMMNAVSANRLFNWRQFISDNKLERHFDEK